MSKVSIVVPCYQNGRTLARTVQSIMGQTVTDWELIAVDDGSRDDTLLALQALAREERLLFHPCDNRFTVGLFGEDFFQRFLPACGHAPRFVKVCDDT